MDCPNQRYEVSDKDGRIYRVDFDPELWRCTVSDGEIVIGYANGIEEADSLMTTLYWCPVRGPPVSL